MAGTPCGLRFADYSAGLRRRLAPANRCAVCESQAEAWTGPQTNLEANSHGETSRRGEALASLGRRRRRVWSRQPAWLSASADPSPRTCSASRLPRKGHWVAGEGRRPPVRPTAVILAAGSARRVRVQQGRVVPSNANRSADDCQQYRRSIHLPTLEGESARSRVAS
jgi:hypothetical protein